MFGLFKKKNYTKELFSLFRSQTDLIEKLVTLVTLLADRSFDKQQQEETESHLDCMCGNWLRNDLGISTRIRKEKGDYYISIGDLEDPDHDFKELYAIRMYKGLSYFVVDSFAIFIEYNKEQNKIFLCGNMAFARQATTAYNYPYPEFPGEFNPN